MKPLTVTNKRILNFYESNPNLDFETVNLVFIDLFSKLFNDMSVTMNNSINKQILNSVKEIQTNMTHLKNDISLRLLESKKEYIEELRNIVEHNTLQSKENVHSMILQMNDKLIDKTKLTLSELLPQQNSIVQEQLSKQLVFIESFMNKELASLKPDQSDKKIMADLMNNFETKFNSLIINITTASESRINQNITDDKNIQQQFRNQISDVLNNVSKNIDSQNDFFDKYKNSSYKGTYGENNLEHILSTLYQSADIINTSKETASGDFMLKRSNELDILIENKDYNRNVPIEEVRKFNRDVDKQKCHGIFLSQHSGITSKQNFQIETKGQKVLLYIHNVNYSPQIIKTAIDIIDSLSDKIEDLNRDNTDDHTIPMDSLNEINTEIRIFLEKRQSLLTLLKEMYTKIEKEIQNIDFSSLCKYIESVFGTIQNKKEVILCDICNTFEAHSNKSLAAHKRKCKKTICL